MPAPQLTSCVTLGQSINLPEPRVVYLPGIRETVLFTLAAGVPAGRNLEFPLISPEGSCMAPQLLP
jgi:hypothetical protein